MKKSKIADTNNITKANEVIEEAYNTQMKRKEKSGEMQSRKHFMIWTKEEFGNDKKSKNQKRQMYEVQVDFKKQEKWIRKWH